MIRDYILSITTMQILQENSKISHKVLEDIEFFSRNLARILQDKLLSCKIPDRQAFVLQDSWKNCTFLASFLQHMYYLKSSIIFPETTDIRNLFCVSLTDFHFHFSNYTKLYKQIPVGN